MMCDLSLVYRKSDKILYEQISQTAVKIENKILQVNILVQTLATYSPPQGRDQGAAPQNFKLNAV